MPEHQQIQQSKKSDYTFQKQATPLGQTPVSNPFSIIQRAIINPKSLTHADIMQLQRTIGNRAVGRLLLGIGSSSTDQQAPVQRQEIPEEEEPLQGKIVGTIQRQEIPEEEEPLQGKMAETIQRQEIPEEEEPLQGKMMGTIQRQEISEDEEPLQGKMIETIQRQEIPEEEEPLQGKFESIQRQEIPEEEEPLQKKSENNTGMPDNLKAGVESISGIDMSGVKVHYNSDKPAEVGALAYTQGMDIHVAPGQERHLPHEAWHVVQQAQDRVQPTMQLKDVSVNDDAGLEKDADEMSECANRKFGNNKLEIDRNTQVMSNADQKVVQRIGEKGTAEDPIRLGNGEFDELTEDPQAIEHKHALAVGVTGCVAVKVFITPVNPSKIVRTTFVLHSAGASETKGAESISESSANQIRERLLRISGTNGPLKIDILIIANKYYLKAAHGPVINKITENESQLIRIPSDPHIINSGQAIDIDLSGTKADIIARVEKWNSEHPVTEQEDAEDSRNMIEWINQQPSKDYGANLIYWKSLPKVKKIQLLEETRSQALKDKKKGISCTIL